MSALGKAVGGRGASWKEKEILDLLDCWGEEKIQEALKSSHRNFDCFAKVAEEMARRGHNRSALECRSKTKTMRLEYKRVVAHNNRSGNAPATCPYYRELDRILRGDASVRPKRVSRSIILQVMEEPRMRTFEPQEGSEELFSHEYMGMHPARLATSTPLLMEGNENREHEASDKDQDLDATIDGLDEHGSGENDNAEDVETIQAEKENEPPMRSPSREEQQETPSRPLAEQSPGTRLGNLRTRSRRTTGLYCVADKMMFHSSKQHTMELEERRREQQEARDWHQEFMDESRQQRLLFQEALSKNFDILHNAVSALHTIGEALLVRQRDHNLSNVPNNPPAISSQQERTSQPKRSCVGRARDRLTM